MQDERSDRSCRLPPTYLAEIDFAFVRVARAKFRAADRFMRHNGVAFVVWDDREAHLIELVREQIVWNCATR